MRLNGKQGNIWFVFPVITVICSLGIRAFITMKNNWSLCRFYSDHFIRLEGAFQLHIADVQEVREENQQLDTRPQTSGMCLHVKV